MSLMKTILLSDEGDESMLIALREALNKLGDIVRDRSHGMTGSQEITLIKRVLGESPLTIESET